MIKNSWSITLTPLVALSAVVDTLDHRPWESLDHLGESNTMFSPSIRVLLVGVLILVAGGAAFQGNDTWCLYLFASVFLIVEHFRGASIWLAFRAYRNQDFGAVRKYVYATAKAEWLRPSSRVYYDFLSGVISSVDGEYKKAEESFLLAVNGKFGTEHMKSVTYCLLADVAFELDETEEARAYLEMARETPHRDGIDPMLDVLTEKLRVESQ